MKKRYLLIITLFLSLSAGSQTLKEFPDDPGEFIRDLPLLYDNIKNEDLLFDIFFVIDSLTAEWQRGSFSQEEKFYIIKASKTLKDRRVKPFPGFYNFFSDILYLHRDKGQVEDWIQNLLDFEKEARFSQINNFLEQYQRFFELQILNNSGSFDWMVTDTSIVFEYDSVPRFLFKETDLYCASRYDTSYINGTSGVYYPEKGLWKGFGGKITWRRFGISEDTIYVDLQEYEIDLGHSNYDIDSVAFFDKRFFDMPMLGSFSEKVFSSRPNKNTTYPEFNSFLKNYTIKELFEGINYEGGVNLKGIRFIGSGDEEKNALLSIRIEDDKNMFLRSKAFLISDDEIRANPASVVISFGEDSLYHPGLKMKYEDESRLLNLFRGEGGLSRSPFFNSYHKVDMFVEALLWNLAEKEINFQSMFGITRESIADFISNNFYSAYAFDRLRGIDDQNPLYVIRNFSNKYGTREISPEILASYMRKPPEQIRAMLIRLSNLGFLYFDVENDRAVVEDRLFSYIDANLGRTDYDVIRIHSETFSESNAVLNLDNLDMLVRGVQEVFLSDSQNVYIYPENREIILKKNRDFIFSGRVRAGLFEFFASDCSFEYDSFRLNLPTVDSLRFKVKSFEKNKEGAFPLVNIDNVIEDLNGTIYIDEPNNKSGLVSHPRYPLFESEEESFVYYDRNDTIYHRDNFKYHIAPFRLESLDKFSTEGLEFSGFLASDGIFPEIEQPLKVQQDYSLGFIKEAPDEGFPVYGGKGRFFSTVDLSNLGLRARGTLRYLTSVTESDDFIFYPDSLVASNMESFLIEERAGQVEYPDVVSDSAYLQWYPYSDSMFVTMQERPFAMYNNEARLFGRLLYTDRDLTGKGVVEYGKAEMFSEDFDFGNTVVEADTLDLRLYDEITDSLLLASNNYYTRLDFEEREILFRSNKENSVISFPYNSYNCTMATIDWDMDENVLVLRNEVLNNRDGADVSYREMLKDPQTSTFFSSNPEMQGLDFFAGYAVYDLSDYIISAEKVPFIKVADAAVFPYRGLVEITEGGKVTPLQNAVVLADTMNTAHLVRQATVEIFSAAYYEASGLYLYTDEADLDQEVVMNEIRVDSLGTTIGKGYVGTDEYFLLNENFSFAGNIEMKADEELLVFEGGYRLEEGCLAENDDTWVYFREKLDPGKIVLPVPDSLRDINGKEIESGIFHSSVFGDVYPALLSRRKVLSDTALFEASGNIYFDTISSSYIITDLSANAEKADKLRFNTRRCVIEGSGNLNMGLDFGSYVKDQAIGKIEYQVIPDSVLLNVSLLFDFYFLDAALKMMSDSIRSSPARGLDLSNDSYARAIDYLLKEDETFEVDKDFGFFTSGKKLPESLERTMFLTDVNMHWNEETRSFISKGRYGISTIGQDQVNRYVNGFVELVRKRSGDELNIYIETSPRGWYFLTYANNFLQVVSSDMEFNARIAEVKPEKRIIKNDDEEEQYEYVVASRRKRINFLRKMDQYNP